MAHISLTLLEKNKKRDEIVVPSYCTHKLVDSVEKHIQFEQLVIVKDACFPKFAAHVPQLFSNLVLFLEAYNKCHCITLNLTMNQTGNLKST